MIETISVLGGGWSARGLDLARLPGTVIAVNDAAIRAPRVDVAISMDRLWTEHRWPQLKARAGATWIRRGCTRNRAGTWDGLVLFACDHSVNLFTDAEASLNGRNSGACALNLAWQMRPARVVLFGFDHTRGPDGWPYWWDEPYPWAPKGATTGGKYQAWAREYALPADAFKGADIEVLNASPASAIPNFKRVDPRKMLLAKGTPA